MKELGWRRLAVQWMMRVLLSGSSLLIDEVQEDDECGKKSSRGRGWQSSSRAQEVRLRVARPSLSPLSYSLQLITRVGQQMSLTSLVPHWDTRQPLTPLLAALPSLLLFLLFLLPSSRLLKLALLPPLIIAALYVPIAYTTGDPAQDFGLASASFQRVLVALDRIVLSDADRDFRRLKDVPPPKIGTLGRVWWAFENVNNARGAGWSWEVRNTPKGGIRARSRWACARAHAGLILLLYLCMDGLSTFMQKQPYFRQQVALVDCGFVEQQIYMVCGAAAGALALNMIYSAVCAMGLTLGIWTPNECPALFGSVPKASSLRGFWGHSWCVSRYIEDAPSQN